MFSARVAVIAFLAITLITRFDQGSALKCRVCISTVDNNCLEDPDKIDPTECKSEPPSVSTEDPSVTTHETTTIVTDNTAATGTTETKIPSTTETEIPTTTETETPTTTQREIPTTTETEIPTTTETETPTTTQREIPTTTETETPTTTETLPDGSETGVNSYAIPLSEKLLRSQIDEDVGDKRKTPEALQIFSRFRRNVPFISRAETSVCYKLVYKDDDKDIVERGCAPKDNGCVNLLEGKNGAECYVCNDKDGCNASSRISIGIMSIIVPVGLVAIFKR